MDVADFGLPRVASQGAISVSASHTSVNDHESLGDHSIRDARDGIASALGVLRGVYDGTVGMTDAAELLREVPSYFPSAPFPPTPSNTPLIHRGSDAAAGGGGGVASSLCSPEAAVAAAPPPPPFFSPAQACSVLSGHIETPGTEAQREVSPTRLVVKQLHRILVDVSHMVRDSDATLLRAAEYGSFLLEEGREKKEELQEAERHRKQVAELMEQNMSLRSEVALWKGVDKVCLLTCDFFYFLVQSLHPSSQRRGLTSPSSWKGASAAQTTTGSARRCTFKARSTRCRAGTSSLRP